MRNAHRWRLEICFINVDRLTSCLLSFVRPVETSTPPPKNTLFFALMRLGGGGGNRTRVQNVSRLPELQLCVDYGAEALVFQALSYETKRSLDCCIVMGFTLVSANLQKFIIRNRLEARIREQHK